MERRKHCKSPNCDAKTVHHLKYGEGENGQNIWECTNCGALTPVRRRTTGHEFQVHAYTTDCGVCACEEDHPIHLDESEPEPAIEYITNQYGYMVPRLVR